MGIPIPQCACRRKQNNLDLQVRDAGFLLGFSDGALIAMCMSDPKRPWE